jgi:hypothetical protein
MNLSIILNFILKEEQNFEIGNETAEATNLTQYKNRVYSCFVIINYKVRVIFRGDGD